MDSYFLNFHNIRFYCLGQESIEINRIKAVKCLEHLRQSYGEYKGRLMEETGKQSYLDTEMEFFAEYNYDACREYKEALLDCARKENRTKGIGGSAEA